ncbi:MAG TPA: response regulator transcription factor [Jiangellaceae bacterium]|nr:response regulator transcription factor [Jiangellaceae bacterium]
MTRVLLVDDDPLVRSGLTLILGADDTIDVVGEVGDGDAAIEAVRQLDPDVVLMDIRMPGTDGLAATEALREVGDEPSIIVLTTFDTDEHVLRALRAGANSFLVKDTPPLEILEAVRRVAAGETVLSPSVVARLVDEVVGGDDAQRQRRTNQARDALRVLSEREHEVALAVGQGKSNTEISAELFMSVNTVKTYISRVLTKLDCDNRVQLAILVHESSP